ncbi:MAG: peptidoglycan DD-metalloendopeptidase family protein [Rhodospirillales bacterium]|nr:peptidoglycan DD-metalloendopeptidase family protein [Rhodospirillales bacterium]
MTANPVIARVSTGIVAALLAVAFAGIVAAAETKKPGDENPGQRLKELEKAIDEGRQKSRQLKEKAIEIDNELVRIRRDMVAAASIIQEQERRAAKVEKELADLRAKEDAKFDHLKARRGQLAKVLVALERVARYPPEALMTQPIPPSDTVRSAILLRAAVPEIEARALRLRDDIDSLAAARRDVAAKKAQFDQVTLGLETERRRLAALFGQQTALKHRTLAQARAAARRMNELAAQATDLRELLDRVRKSRQQLVERTRAAVPKPGKDESPRPEPAPTVEGLPAGLTGAPITGQRGKLPPPVVGRILGRYGEVSSTGLTQKGLTLETAPGAQVVAPYEGNVVYAGQFRGYGELLIIEHGEGYHSLLAGLSRIDSTIGQWVVAGEPVGVMGRSETRRPVLYVELRRNGQPINPLPWLAAQR